MPDREKVIRGLECCILRDPDDHARCSQCSYGGNCVNRLKMDALELLKAQEPVKPIVMGKWRKLNNPNYSPFDGSDENLLYCSECGFLGGRISYEYCPLCGAKMEPPKEET